MTETGNEPTAVDVELVSVEDLESMEVIAKVGDKTSEINFLAKADSALQIISDALETIPEKGLFKVEVPEGFTLQDLAPVKGEEGAFGGYREEFGKENRRTGKTHGSRQNQPYANSRSGPRCCGYGGRPSLYDRNQRQLA